MKKTIASLLILFCMVANAQDRQAQLTVRELRGNIIGSKYSVDYDTRVASTTVNTKKEAFDNDPKTFFASYDRSYSWVGLDLVRPYIIKKISFTPRANQANRVVLGVFEGANHKDFTDAVPLYVIKSQPLENMKVTVNINVSRGFRYVRYVGPNDARCNIAELKFFGIPGAGNTSQYYTVTNLPTVSIHTVGAEEVTSKENYLKGIINVISQEGKNIFTDSMNIKGRGNASWWFPKKPYRIKLFNKARLLGMPSKAKDWTLINNYGDKTLIRNCLAFQISRDLKMAYTPACSMVDVLFNGEYKGTYQLCDKIEIGKGRVDIQEMTPDDNILPNISGGYLLEIDGYAYLETSKFSSGYYHMPITIKKPNERNITYQQHNYIERIFNQMEMVLHGPTYQDEVFGIDSKFDRPSFIKHLIVGELSANSDTYHSTYIYKDRNSPIFHVGPVWDFDIAFENDNRFHPIAAKKDFLFREGGSNATGTRDFAERILGISEGLMQQIWSEARYNNGLSYEAYNHHIDSLTTLISESQTLNFMRWPILDQMVHQNYQALGSYKAEVGVVRDFLKYRFKWMDNKIGLVPVGIKDITGNSVRIYTNGNGITFEGADANAFISIYDTNGIIVNETESASGSGNIDLQPGIYIVKIQNGADITRKKILVR